MSAAVVVRQADASDLPVVVNFALALARESENRRLDRETVTRGAEGLLSNPQFGFYLVAESNGEIAGSLMVTIEYSDWRDGLYWWIQSVYVQPAFRRRGVYRELYRTVKTKAAQQGNVRGFRLYVAQSNRIAQRVYESQGMRKNGFEVMEEMVG